MGKSKRKSTNGPQHPKAQPTIAKKSFYDKFFAGEIEEDDLIRPYGKEAIGINSKESKNEVEEKESEGEDVETEEIIEKKDKKEKKDEKEFVNNKKGKTGDNDNKEVITDRIKIAELNYQKWQEQKEQERMVREKMAKERKKAKKERNKKTKIMMTRTKRGQPVLKLQLSQLVSKIEKSTKQ